MKDLSRLSRILQAFVRLYGFSPSDANGKYTKWFLVTLLLSSAELIAIGLFLRDIIHGAVAGDLALRTMLTFSNAASMFAFILSNLLNTRHSVTIEELQLTKDSPLERVNYNISFILIHAIVMPIIRTIHVFVLVIDLSQRKFTSHQAIYSFFNRFFPEVRMFTGMMYYCSLLQVLKQQLQHLNAKHDHPVERLILHDQLLQRCLAIQRSHCFQVILCLLNTVAGAIWNEIWVHNLTFAYIHGTTPFIRCLLTNLTMSYRLLLMFNIFNTCVSMQSSADDFMEKLNYRLVTGKETMDVRLYAYAISKPRSLNSIEGYLDADLNTFGTIVITLFTYYIMVVDMKLVYLPRRKT